MAVEWKLPDLGENVTYGTVVQLLVAAGDRIAPDQPVLALETDKAVVEIPSTERGTVVEVRVSKGEKVRVGQTILVVETGAAASPAPSGEPLSGSVPPAPAGAPVPPTSTPASAGTSAPRFASPAVRQAAREVGVDIASVTGSGPGGRVSYGDVLKAAGAGGVPEPPPLPDFSAWGPVERQPFSGIRRVTAERLARSWAAIPHVPHFDAADVTRLEAMRKRQADAAGPDGPRVSITAALVRIVAGALRAFPAFNASVDMARGEIVLKQYVNIGVAVDTGHGLLVPVIRDADRKDVRELSSELALLAEKARNRKLAPGEMQGGCFTISNLGGLGGKYFAPIINPPEVAILGVGRAAVEPVFVDGAFLPRPRMPLTLCYDHRVIDGADAVRFLRWVVEAVEDPDRAGGWA